MAKKKRTTKSPGGAKKALKKPRTPGKHPFAMPADAKSLYQIKQESKANRKKKAPARAAKTVSKFGKKRKNI